MSDVHLFLFFLLVTGFSWDAGGVPVSWKTRSLSVKRARSICSMHLLAGAVKEDYEAGLKMVHVTCRHVMPSVGSMESPV